MRVRRLIHCFCWSALAFALLAPSPAGYARSKPDPERAARKIEKRLAHFKKGELVRVVLTNGDASTGTVGELGERSFTLTNVETNAQETHNYLEVNSVSKGKEEIGKGSGERHHHGPF